METVDTTLQTPRLLLRPYRLSDLDDIAAILGDDETMRYYPAPFTRRQSRVWIERNLRRYRVDGFGLWAMELRGTGEFAGNCGPTRQVVDGIDEIEIGWHVKRSLWNRGLATEAARACRDQAFERFGLDRVISLVRPENVASARVAEKIGMTVEKESFYGGFDHHVYALSRGRWEAVTAASA